MSGDYGPLLGAAGIPLRTRRRRPRRPGPDGAEVAVVVNAGSNRMWWALLAVAVVAEQAAFIASWWVLGGAVLDDTGVTAERAIAWVVLLAVTVAARTASVWVSGRIGVGIGAGARRRLIASILGLDPDTICHRGAGQFLGVVAETGVVETATVAGALAAATGLAFAAGGAAVVIAVGPPATWLALSGWALAMAAGATALWPRRRRWHTERRRHTETLIEALLGHRTVQLQDDHRARRAGDTAALARYDAISRRADRLAAALAAGVGRTWLAVAVTALTVTVDTDASAALLAAFGGCLLVAQGSELIGRGVLDLADARLAARAVAEITGLPVAPAVDPGTGRGGEPVVADKLGYTYPGTETPAIEDVDLTVKAGERVLLTGESGSGKTTLAHVIAGLRPPTTGTLHRSGTTALVPQYDDNHVLLGTIAYNLLLGLAWPPRAHHLDAAEAVCAELGLQPLLERMPSGIFENVGETGWQLSHGERARIYLARALLTCPDLAIVDESFGTLDPDTHRRALATAVERSRSTIVIAHP